MVDVDSPVEAEVAVPVPCPSTSAKAEPEPAVEVVAAVKPKAKRGAARSGKRSKKSSTVTASPAQRSNARPKARSKKSSKAHDESTAAADLSHRITDYFPTVRRSERKPSKLIKEEQELAFHELVLREAEPDLDIVQTELKGRGIHAGRSFRRQEFVVEYRGHLVSPKEAKRREAEYRDNSNVGCYMYYFECGGSQWCVDATAESKYLGRLINHSAKRPNLYTKAVLIGNKPHLVLLANRDIEKGEELLYNYGERSKEVIEENPWLIHT